MAGNATDVKQLQLQISASTELLVRNLKSAESAVALFRKDTETKLDAVDSRFYKLGFGIGVVGRKLAEFGGSQVTQFLGVLAGGTLVKAAKDALDYAGSLGETADALGVGTDFLQKFRFAASQTGGSVEDADTAIGKLAKTVGAALTGNKQAAENFRELGIKIADAGGKAKPLEEIYGTVADAISRLSDPSRQAAYAQAFFGKGATSLIPLLRSGAAGYGDLAAQAQKLGIVLSRDLIDQADNASDSMAAMKNVLSAQFASAVVQNANAIQQLAQSLYNAAGGVAKFLASDPGRALEIGGGLAGASIGARIGGLPGAAVGYVAGTAVGQHADPNFDKNVRGLAAYEQQHGGWARMTASREDALAAADRADAEARITAKRGFDYVRKQRAQYPEGDPRRDPYSAKMVEYGKQLGLDKPQAASTAAGKKPSSLSPLTPDIRDPAVASAAKAAAAEAERLRKEAIQNEKSYQQELARSQHDYASAQAELTNSADQRLAIELEQIAAARQAKDAAVDSNQALGKISAAHAAELKAVYAKTAATEREVVLAKDAQRKAEDATNLQLTGITNRSDLVSAQSQLALTAADRKDAELRLLALQEQEERIRLEAVKASRDSTDAQKVEAQTRIDALPTLYAARAEGVKRQNQTPGEAYLATLHKTSGQINEDIENIEVQGLTSLDDALSNSVTNALHLHGVLGTILSDLVKIGVERAIIAPLADSLFGAAGGGGSGGLFSSLLGGLFGGGRAAGGSVDPSRWNIVGEKGPEIFVPKVAGTIIPNHALGGGQTVNQSFDLRGAWVDKDVWAEVDRRSISHASQAYQLAVATSTGNLRQAGRSSLPGV